MTTETIVRRKPPKLDQKRIRMEERAYVTRAVNTARRADRRLALASEIVDEAEKEIAPLRPQRDAAALSLSLYDGVRAVQDIIGVSRAYFHSMRCKALRLTEQERDAQWLLESAPGVRRTKAEIATRAEVCGVPQIPDAADITVDLGERIARAEARAADARQVRDVAIVELSRAGWSRGQIADVAKVDESRISQIVGAASTVAP